MRNRGTKELPAKLTEWEETRINIIFDRKTVERGENLTKNVEERNE